MKRKKSYKSNKFKISVTAWVEECELSDGSYSILDTKDCYKYIVKKQVKLAGKPSLQTNINKIQKRVTFKIKFGYYLKLLTVETRNIFGSTEQKITKDRNEVELVHCNIVNS